MIQNRNIKSKICLLFSYFFLFLVIYFFIKPQISRINYSITSNLTIIKPKHIIPRLFFGILTTDNAIERHQRSYEEWISKIVELGHDYAFFTDNKAEGPYKYQTLYESILSLTHKRRRDINIQMKRLAITKFFVENTTADFLFNTGDDVLVDYNRINRLAMILGKRYDTHTNVSFLGNCYCAPRKTLYIQGGSGLIMTRAGAIEFLKHSERWLRESHRADDVELNRILVYMNLTSYDAMSPYLAGHVPQPMHKNDFNLSTLETCPNIWNADCGEGVHSLKDLYLIHDSNLTEHKAIWTNFQNLINDKENKYGWYGKWPVAFVCKMNPLINYTSRDPNDDALLDSYDDFN